MVANDRAGRQGVTMTGNGIGQGLSDMWRSVLLFLPKALVFVVILAVGYVLARLLRTLVAKGLRRAGFDKAVSRGTVGRALRNVSAADLCAKIVFYAVLLFALQLAFGIWGPNPVSDLLTALIAWLPRAFVAIVIVVVAAAIAGAVHDLLVSALGRSKPVSEARRVPRRTGSRWPGPSRSCSGRCGFSPPSTRCGSPPR